MAIQIISDLGLHRDLESEYGRLGPPGREDEIVTLRRNLFCSAYTVET
jgi:hypothetical protein